VRPVNLIPPEARRGEKAPMRTGVLSYVIVAVLAVALLGVTGVVLTNNQISDREAEKFGLESQVAEAEAQARRVSSFANFASLQQAREQTVSTLAQSRFDWERVLRELAIVIPEDVWLTNLTATVSPEVQLGDSGSSSSSAVSGLDSVQGPALQMEGCGDGHEAVARFLAALRDIDGVTRVSVLSSDRPDPSSATEGSSAGAAGSGGGASGDCATRDFISKFSIVAAFDAVQISATPEATAPSATSEPTASGSTASTADESQLSAGTATAP
jgi:Tfp pilus assembly protein PilN